MIINYKKLVITNHDYKNTKDNPSSINITGDWAPKLGGISDILIAKQEKYYGDLLPYFKDADLNIINLETVIDTKKREFSKGAVRLIDKPEVLSSLKNIDTHLVCMANNHIMDNGKEGLNETIKHLQQNDIDYVGAGVNKDEIYKPFLYEKDGQKIAIINTAEGEEANEKYNNHCGASDIESYKIIDQIRQSKQNGYFVILIAHAGVEFIPTPPPHIQELYRAFVDEGADLVVAHHPHVPQGFEIYNDVPIFYSLGNFGIFRKLSRKMEKIGYMINITVVKNTFTNIKILPYEISQNGLNLLKDINLNDFKRNFIKSSTCITNKDILNRIWDEYIYFRYPVLELKNIVNFYKTNENLSKTQQVGLMSQFSRRFIFLSQKDLKEFNYTDYLMEFGCVKNLSKFDKLFLIQKNMFNKLYKLYSLYYTLGRKIKRLIRK